MFQNEKIAILYGSQTGNAQDLAERIWRDSKRFYFRSIIKALDEYNILNLGTETCVIFICSTTGQGEEPDNMKIFWKFLLRKNLPITALSKLRFAVFGLGDSSYTKFNFVAKRLYRRLQQLGANSVIHLGLGDDQHDLGYDAAADLWIENLWKNLLVLYPLPSNVQPLSHNTNLKLRWNVSISFLQSNNLQKQQSIYYSIRKSTDFTGTVIQNKRLTHPDHFQDVRLLKFRTDGQKYVPGDVLALRPHNLPWKIQEFKEVLLSNGVDIPDNAVFNLTQNDSEVPVPEVLKYDVTFEQLYSEYFDLMALPRRHTFEVLANLTDSELEKEKCYELASAHGQDEFLSYAYRPRRNLVEILRDFPHATKNITKDILFEIFPPIKPREFSIASSYKAHPDEVHILLAVVKYKTKLVKERFGLASNYLADLQEGSKITMRFKRGSFRFPDDPKIPVIMVGPGTGVAPFRSFLFERYKDKDFLCKEDFDLLQQNKVFALIHAFSREDPDKVYVQHRIVENQKLVWETLEKGGYIFVAGNSKNMPQGVREAFIDVCMQSRNKTKEEATKYIEYLEKTGRYQCEAW